MISFVELVVAGFVVGATIGCEGFVQPTMRIDTHKIEVESRMAKSPSVPEICVAFRLCFPKRPLSLISTLPNGVEVL